MSNFVEIKDKDGVTLGQLPVSSEGGRLRNIVYITETAQYEKPAWLKFVRVRGVGGGGQSGGTPSTTSTQRAVGGGGESGACFEKKIAATELSSSETVTIGAGGDSAAAGAQGQNGGATSFGNHCTAQGGNGGGVQAAIDNTSGGSAVGGSGAVATGGDINISGTPGSRMTYYMSFLVSSPCSAASYLSGATQAAANEVVAGVFPGGGGTPIYMGTSKAAQVGAAGAPGIVIIEEYE